MSQSQKKLLRALMRRLGHSAVLGNYMNAQLSKHPRPDSLASYHYALSWMGIENLGVNTSSETLATEIPMPAIVHLSQGGNSKFDKFTIVEKIDAERVVTTDGLTTERLSRKEFDTSFSGNCIVMAPDSELIYNRKDFICWLLSHCARYTLPVAITVATVLRLFTPGPTGLFEGLFALLFAIGLTASALLFSKQEGALVKLAEAICRSGGEVTDCSKVTGSKGGKLLGLVSWSDIGVIYFVTALISLLLFGYERLNLVFAIMAVFSIPYAFYSIWYQWRVVHTWCPLCLIVQGVFVGQLILAILDLGNSIHFFLWPTIGFVLTGLIIAALFFVIQPVIRHSMRYPQIEAAAARFRGKPEVRQALLTRVIDTSSVGHIMLNPDGEGPTITFVFSTYCGPCISKIKQLLSFIPKHDIKLNVVFNMKNYESQRERGMVEYFMMQYFDSPDKLVAAMHDFVDDYSVMREQNKAFVSPRTEAIQQMVDIHKNWYEGYGLVGTPIILLNNIEFTNGYMLDDLELMLLENQ